MSLEFCNPLQNQAHLDSQLSFVNLWSSISLNLMPSSSRGPSSVVLFHAFSLSISPVNRLGNLDDRCGASTNTSCPGRTIRSNHLEILEATTRATISSLGLLSFGL